MTNTERKKIFHRVCDLCHKIYKLEKQEPLELDNENFQESYDKALKELHSALLKMIVQERKRKL